MLAYLSQAVFLLIGMLLVSEAVKFIQFNVACRNIGDELFVKGGYIHGWSKSVGNGGRR